MEDPMNQTHNSILLEGQRIILRPLRLSDAEEVYKNWTSDPEVAKYVRWNTHENVEVTREWLAQCEANIGKTGHYDWGIVIRDTDEMIGSIGAGSGDGADRYEVGYCIGRRYWGQGYTTEALRLMVDYLVSKEDIRHFSATHAIENPASGAVMKKAGFVCVSCEGTCCSFDGERKFAAKEYHLDR